MTPLRRRTIVDLLDKIDTVTAIYGGDSFNHPFYMVVANHGLYTDEDLTKLLPNAVEFVRQITKDLQEELRTAEKLLLAMESIDL